MEHFAALDAQQLRQAYSRLAAGTSVVTMIAPEGTKIGLTVSAVTSVSVEPPLMLVCINSKSRAIGALESGVPFVINLLSRSQEAVGMQFASREADKFAGVAHDMTDSGALYLSNTLANIECVPHEIVPTGDHYVVIGAVTDVRLGDDAPPLVFFRSRFMA